MTAIRATPVRAPRAASRAVRPATRDASARRSSEDRPTLRLVTPAATGWARTVAFGAVVFLAALAVAVAIQGARISSQERYDALTERVERARETNRDLRVAVARAESPEVILDAARGLGMIEPGPVVPLPAGPPGTGASPAAP